MILAIVEAALLLMTAILAETLPAKLKPWMWGFFVALLFGQAWLQISEKNSTKVETDALHGDIRDLNGQVRSLDDQLRKSETQRQIDNAVLTTKLGDYGQLGPALMKLATVSADFQKKQYEQKVLADHDLYEMTAKVVAKIRDFQKKHQETSERIALVGQIDLKDMSEEERHKAWAEQTNKLIQDNFNEQAEFQAMLPDILYVRGLLLARKMPEPQLSQPAQSMVKAALSSGFANSFSESALATYLELMAKPLANR